MKKKRKKKTSCAVNWLRGLVSAPDVPNRKNRDAVSFAASLADSGCDDVALRTFAIKVAENVVVKWDTVLCNDKMFIIIPNVLSPVGSKESFISLLEVADEDLSCKSVICCIPSSTPELSSHLRTFMYMGFQRILPDCLMLPAKEESHGNFVLLACEL